jgi:hypothetical protein
VIASAISCRNLWVSGKWKVVLRFLFVLSSLIANLWNHLIWVRFYWNCRFALVLIVLLTRFNTEIGIGWWRKIQLGSRNGLHSLVFKVNPIVSHQWLSWDSIWSGKCFELRSHVSVYIFRQQSDWTTWFRDKFWLPDFIWAMNQPLVRKDQDVDRVFLRHLEMDSNHNIHSLKGLATHESSSIETKLPGCSIVSSLRSSKMTGETNTGVIMLSLWLTLWGRY